MIRHPFHRLFCSVNFKTFLSWGLTCITCRVVVKEKFEPNLTPKQIEERGYHEKTRDLSGRSKDWSEYLARQQKYKVIDKLQRLQRKKMCPEPMTPRESGLRTRIRNYEAKHHWWYNDKIKDLINWPLGICSTFLNIIPRA